ncbi:hypothetical protein LSCM1_07744 [Leishmania martiniquensis]|uniref:Uncharacterized protein n=1 Tax=Leishmania martiniquensis TaxID=1580590 RepID=A0A836H940_9TRYP|nr:hypothetical protein LSCM1_07744 [Leishmania martiniquensis]
MEDDAEGSTASIQFSIASSNLSGRGGGSGTMSASNNSNGSGRAGGGDVPRPMPTRGPKPMWALLSASQQPPLQAIHLREVPNKTPSHRSPSSEEVKTAFMQAVRRLDLEGQQLCRSGSPDSYSHDDGSDSSCGRASLRRRREKAVAGGVAHDGTRTPPSRQLRLPQTKRTPQQPRLSAAEPTASTTSSGIHFTLARSCDTDEENKMAAAAADAAPPSRTKAAQQVVLPPPPPPPPPLLAVGPFKAPPAGTALPVVRPSEKLAPKKLLVKVVTGVASVSGGPRQLVARQTPPPPATPGTTSTLSTAAVGGATPCTVSPTNPECFTLPFVDLPHQRLLSATVQSEEDPAYCTVSEMTVANAMSVRGNASLRVSNLSNDVLKSGGAVGGGPHSSSARPSVPPTAAGRRGQSLSLSVDACNAPAALSTPREVVASAAAPSYKALDLRTQPLSTVAQWTPLNGMVDDTASGAVRRCSPPPPPPPLLQRHAGHERGVGEERTLMPGSPLLPRGAQAGGESAPQEHSRPSSILKSLRTKTICGDCTASVAAKSGAATDGAAGSLESRTSLRSSGSRRSTLSSLASGLSRISSILKRRFSRPAQGSAAHETPQPFRPSPSSVQQQEQHLTPQQEEITSTAAAVAAAAQRLTSGYAREAADISVSPSSAGVLPSPQQQQQQPAAAPVAVPETAATSQPVSAPRMAATSASDASAELLAYKGKDGTSHRGTEAAALSIAQAAAATPAAPVGSASSGAGGETCRRKKDDAECLDRRRRRQQHCRRCAGIREAAPSSSSEGGVGDRRRSCSCDSSTDGTNASSSASAPRAKRAHRRCKEGERWCRRQGREQGKEVAGDVPKRRQAGSPSEVPPLESQFSDGAASSDGQRNHNSSRRGRDDNRRDLVAGGTTVPATKARQGLYSHALCGDGDSSRSLHRSYEGARRDALLHDSPGRGDSGDVVPQPPTPSAAVLAARRREMHSRSRFLSSVNHFAISWRARQEERHRQEQLLRRDGQTRLAQLRLRDAERKSRSEEAAVAAAVSAAASRTASLLRSPARAQRSAAEAHQTSTTAHSPRQVTPSRLEQYEAALARDLIVLNSILEKRRRRELWAEASPEAAAAAATAEAEATPPPRPSRATRRCARSSPRLTAGPPPSRVGDPAAAVASAETRMKESYGNSAHVTPRYSGRSSSSPAPREAAAPAKSTAAPSSGARTAAEVREPLQQPPTAASTLHLASNATGTVAQAQRPSTADIKMDDADASPHRSDSVRRSGDAAHFAISALQRRYEQLLQDAAAQTASQPPASTESNSGGTSRYEMFIKARSRRNRSGHGHLCPRQHFSQEHNEERPHFRAALAPSERWRRFVPTPTGVTDLMEAGLARCAAALRAEYYESCQSQRPQQQQEPSKAIDWGFLPPAAHEAGANTVSIAHVTASYAQALRPSCAGCRPQQLDEYITLALLSMMHWDADERGGTAAAVATGEMTSAGESQPKSVAASTLVQRRPRADLYAAPQCAGHHSVLRGKGRRRPACADGSIAPSSPAAPHSLSSGAFLSSALSDSAQPLRPFTPTPTAIYNALRARLMRRESRARRECASTEREARYALQRLYILETILVLRVACEAVERHEREASAQWHEPPLPQQSTIAENRPYHLSDVAAVSYSSLVRSHHEPVTPALSTSRGIQVTATAPDHGGGSEKSDSAVLSDRWVGLPAISAASSLACEEGRGMPSPASLSAANSKKSWRSSSGVVRSGPPSPIAEDSPPGQRILSCSRSPSPAVAMDADLSDGPRGGSMTAVGSLLCLASAEATPLSSAQRGGRCSRSLLSTTRSGSDANVEEGSGTVGALTKVTAPVPREQSAAGVATMAQRVAASSSSSKSSLRAATSPAAAALASVAEEDATQSLSAAVPEGTTATADAVGEEEKDAGGSVNAGDAAAAPSLPMSPVGVMTEEAEEDNDSSTAPTQEAIRGGDDGVRRDPEAGAQRATVAQGEDNGAASQGADVAAARVPMCNAAVLGTHKISPLPSLPVVSVRPPPPSVVAMDADGEAEQGASHSGDADPAESRSSSSSSSWKLSSLLNGDSHGGGGPQPSDSGAGGADDAHVAVASGSPTAAVPDTAAQPSADKSTYLLSPVLDALAKAPSAPTQAAEARPLSIDRGEHIADSSPRSDAKWVASSPPGTESDAPNSGVAGSPSSAAKHTDSTPRSSPPPAPPSSLAYSSAASWQPLEAQVAEEVGAGAGTAAESGRAVNAAHSSGDAGATSLEAMAYGALQRPLTPADAAVCTANTPATASTPKSETEGPVGAEDGSGQTPIDSPTHQRERQRMRTAASHSRRRVRFSFPVGGVSGDDGMVDASKRKREEGQDSLRSASGLRSMLPRDLEDASSAAADGDERVVSRTDLVAADLLERLTALDALLLHSFPNYFTTGTEEDGLPGVVMRRHGHPTLVSPRSPQPSAPEPALQPSKRTAPAAEGRGAAPSSAAAAAASSPRGAYTAPLHGHLTPPRLPPESLASKLRRKYGLSQPQRQCRASEKMMASGTPSAWASLADTPGVRTSVPIGTDVMGRASVNASPCTRQPLRDELYEQRTSTSLGERFRVFTREEADASAPALSVKPLDTVHEQPASARSPCGMQGAPFRDSE